MCVCVFSRFASFYWSRFDLFVVYTNEITDKNFFFLFFFFFYPAKQMGNTFPFTFEYRTKSLAKSIFGLVSDFPTIHARCLRPTPLLCIIYWFERRENVKGKTLNMFTSINRNEKNILQNALRRLNEAWAVQWGRRRRVWERGGERMEKIWQGQKYACYSIKTISMIIIIQVVFFLLPFFPSFALFF